MKKRIFLFILSGLTANFLSGQSAADLLNANAVDAGHLDTLSDAVYQIVQPFDVIMLGEMHGTNEPAKFTLGLARKIVEKEGHVCVGIEIPRNKINLQQHEINNETLLHTVFFQQENIDGRNGVAWFDLVLHCAANDHIKLFFMDNDLSKSQDYRDSIMYLEVCQMKIKYPDSKIITLSGNVHNWLIPFREEKKMGNFIASDSTLFDKERIMSVNHIYNEGTMLNNSGKGLELKKIEGRQSIYSTAVPFENYFCKRVFGSQEQNNYFLYTTKVSHSSKITERR